MLVIEALLRAADAVAEGFHGDHAPHLRGIVVDGRGIVGVQPLVGQVHAHAVVIYRGNQHVGGFFIGVGRAAGDVAVAHARELSARITVGHSRAAGDGDLGEQTCRVVGQRGHTAHAVGNAGQSAGRIVAQRRAVAAGVRHAQQELLVRVGGQREHQLRVALVGDGQLRGGRGELQAHALRVRVGLGTADGEEVLRRVAVRPDVVIRRADGLLAHALVHTRAPAVAAGNGIALGQAAVVHMGDRHGHTVAGGCAVGVLKDQIAVEQIDIGAARAAGAHGFVLPPAFAAGVGYVVDDDARALGAVVLAARPFHIVAAGRHLRRTA